MTMLDQLPQLRGALILEIEAALKQGGGPEFYDATERLKAGDALLAQAAALWTKTHTPAPLERVNGSTVYQMSNQAKAEQTRSDWVTKNLGKSLTRITGTLYRNTRGEVVGIAYANEKEDRAGRWFLGLPENSNTPDLQFQNVILLCHSLNDRLDAVCLPQRTVNQYRSKLSTSHKQVKFNVSKRENAWFWSVPGEVPIAVTVNINKFSLVV